MARRWTSVLVEAVNPLVVRLPDKDVQLVPGVPTELASRYARRLLQTGKVRLVVAPHADWLTLWTYVIDLSNGLLRTDPRLPAVLHALEACDHAFEQGSKGAFITAILEVAEAMQVGRTSQEQGV